MGAVAIAAAVAAPQAAAHGDGGGTTPRPVHPTSVVRGPDGAFYIGDATGSPIQGLGAGEGLLRDWASQGRIIRRGQTVYYGPSRDARPVPRAGKTSRLEFVTKWGKGGTDPGEFSHQVGLAVDSTGRFIYVADTDNSRIQKFTTGGKYLASLGRETGAHFSTPTAVALDPSERFLYVAEFVGGNRVQKLTPAGRPVAVVATAGSGNGQVLTPDWVMTDPAGNLYVTEVGNNRIQEFTADGRFVRKWGSFGAGNSQWVGSPHGIAQDARGDLYAVDSFINRVQKFTAEGGFIRAWGTTGKGNGNFMGPHGVAVDNNGDVWISELGNSRIQKFTADGKFLARFGRNGGDGSSGTGDGEFNFIEAIATDCRGYVYVSDSNNSRIQKFRDSSVRTNRCRGGKSARDSRPPRISIRGVPRKCARRSFRARVRIGDDSELRRGRAYVDRRRVRRTRRKNYRIRVRVARLAPGRHRIRVRATDASGNRARKSKRFRRCT